MDFIQLYGSYDRLGSRFIKVDNVISYLSESIECSEPNDSCNTEKSNNRLLSSTKNSAEIFCLGNELLIGRTINKNANEIALELTKIGLEVQRETTVRDDLHQASQALKEILVRKPTVIVITGGLGPTHDDIQLEVIAKALNSTLELSDLAVEMLEKRYHKPRSEIAVNQLKMAHLPKGAIALHNSEGSAPGSMIKYNGTLIFSLPGVPREMRAILTQEIIPNIINIVKPGTRLYEFGFSAYDIGESKLEEFTVKAMAEYPDVGFKTHPRKDDNMYWVQLHAYKLDVNDDRVKSAIEMWYNLIKDKYEVKMTEISPIFTSSFQGE